MQQSNRIWSNAGTFVGPMKPMNQVNVETDVRGMGNGTGTERVQGLDCIVCAESNISYVLYLCII